MQSTCSGDHVIPNLTHLGLGGPLEDKNVTLLLLEAIFEQFPVTFLNFLRSAEILQNHEEIPFDL